MEGCGAEDALELPTEAPEAASHSTSTELLLLMTTDALLPPDFLPPSLVAAPSALCFHLSVAVQFCILNCVLATSPSRA